ncbi:MAG: hypothetical protein IJ307_03960 [Bacteroidales bacterium]|nr:hypothetical protein [Bacteroidales bacterium]
MKAGTFILMGALSLMLASCSKEAAYDNSLDDGIRLEGLVIDAESDAPVNHVEILIEWESVESPVTIYSSDKGRFSTILSAPEKYPAVISLTLTDIDGEENGGLFEGLSDKITILEEGDFSEPSILTYRLSRATASESSPQSL